MLNHKGTQEIKTERLVLRAVKADDYKDMYEYMRMEEMSKYVTWKRHENENVTKALCEMWVSQYTDERYNWAITLDGKAVGNIDVIGIYGTTAYIGYQIRPELWNKGMVTEALKTVIKYMFVEIGCDKCEAAYLEENPASGRVMKKTGMKQIRYDESDAYKAKKLTEFMSAFKGKKIVINNITREEWKCRNIQ